MPSYLHTLLTFVTIMQVVSMILAEETPNNHSTHRIAGSDTGDSS